MGICGEERNTQTLRDLDITQDEYYQSVVAQRTFVLVAIIFIQRSSFFLHMESRPAIMGDVFQHGF